MAWSSTRVSSIGTSPLAGLARSNWGCSDGGSARPGRVRSATARNTAAKRMHVDMASRPVISGLSFPDDVFQSLAEFGQESRLAVPLHVVGVDAIGETFEVPHSEGRVGLEIGQKAITIPGQRTRPGRKSRDVQPVFQNLRTLCREHFEILFQIPQAVDLLPACLLRIRDVIPPPDGGILQKNAGRGLDPFRGRHAGMACQMRYLCLGLRLADGRNNRILDNE